MPIKKCKMPDGSSGWKYGDKGKCYKSKKDAIKQGIAIDGDNFHANVTEQDMNDAIAECIMSGEDLEFGRTLSKWKKKKKKLKRQMDPMTGTY